MLDDPRRRPAAVVANALDELRVAVDLVVTVDGGNPKMHGYNHKYPQRFRQHPFIERVPCTVFDILLVPTQIERKSANLLATNNNFRSRPRVVIKVGLTSWCFYTPVYQVPSQPVH